MIRSYRTKSTSRFANGERVKEFESIAQQARKRLGMLNVATSLSDLAAISGNRLEPRHGRRGGQHRIRINKQWRICFVWNEADGCAELVEIVDYH